MAAALRAANAMFWILIFMSFEFSFSLFDLSVPEVFVTQRTERNEIRKALGALLSFDLETTVRRIRSAHYQPGNVARFVDRRQWVNSIALTNLRKGCPC